MAPAHLETDPATVLDPGRFPDEPWAAALSEDPTLARDRFVTALREGPPRTATETDGTAIKRRWYGSDPGYERGFDLDPDAVIEGWHIGVYGIEHQFEGEIDWYANPSESSEEYDFTKEWQWQLNRHYQWITLADAYAETGAARYAEHFEKELRSWIRNCLRPDDSGNYYPSAWRTLEAAGRAGWVWPYAFETFRRSEHVSDEALWWWVCSFRDHGRHLLRHVTNDNWKISETNGLIHVGGMFPELNGADTYVSTAIDRAIAEIERQFYPDGLQTELAPGYAMMTVRNCTSVLGMARHCQPDDYGRVNVLVPQRAHDRLIESARAYARLAAPDGRCPKLHDSKSADARPLFDEFLDGEPPWTSGASDHLPWGGYGIVRNGTRYAMLDAGPYGTGHQHQDTLAVVGHAGGEWVLVDPGSPQYTDSSITRHIRSAAGHNTVLLDGTPHSIRPETHRATTPPPMAVHETGPLAVAGATRTFETDGGAWFDHERLLVDLAAIGWLVFDRLFPQDSETHTAEWLWHAPGAVTADGGGGTLTGEQEATVSLTTDGSTGVTSATVSGQTDPIRGWGPSGESSQPEPLPTLQVQTEPWRDRLEAVTLLATAEATLSETLFEERPVTAAIEAADGRHSLTFADSSDRVSAISYETPSTGVEIAVDEHDLLAER